METLSREDQDRVDLGLSLDTPQKRDRYVSGLVEKWGAAGWLNAEDAKSDKAKRVSEILTTNHRVTPLKADRDKKTLALILENQARFQSANETRMPIRTDENGNQYVVQAAPPGGETSTGSESLPTRAVMPIIRRIYAVVTQNDLSQVQPMSGPTSYVFWLDFIRSTTQGSDSALSTNLLSLDYNHFLTPELGVPAKGALQLTQRQISAVKQMLGVTWSTEAEEDAKALLNLNIESELMNAFGEEFVRDLFMRHITEIYQASAGNAEVPSVGQSLPSPWTTNLPSVAMPNLGSGQSLTDYKQAIYAAIIDADTQFLAANRRPAKKIMAGYQMAAFLQKLNTATGSENPDPGDMSSIGFSNYGTYAARFQIVGTEFLPTNVAIMYTPNPDPLHAGHVYAPYVPVQAGPKVYADYDTSTGSFINNDAWTRTLRERSAQLVTKPYAFQLLTAPSGGFAQWA